jgi:uncharacterized phage protein (TIGR01671 family)
MSRRVGKRGRRGGMMREIKFRAWKESEKRMVGWGELLCRDGSSLLGDVLTGVYLKAVMQYVGLKDKNGKEIYESDVVIFDNNPEFDSVVKWEDGAFRIALNKKQGYVFPLNAVYAETCEVIGNIYES